MSSDRVGIKRKLCNVIRNSRNQFHVADGLIANRELRYLQRGLQTRIRQRSVSRYINCKISSNLDVLFFKCLQVLKLDSGTAHSYVITLLFGLIVEIGRY